MLQESPTLSAYRMLIESLGHNIRFNELTQQIMDGDEVFTDLAEHRLRVEMKDKGMSMAMTSEVIQAIAYDHTYNPIKEWLSRVSGAWDGVDHIGKLATYFDDEYGVFPLYLRKWLVGAVTKIYDPNTRNPMLVLDGPQHMGKSMFAQWLCPLPEYFKEGAIQPNDKDYRLALTQTWIWEVAEVENTTSRTEASALKAFLSMKTVTERRPYARAAVEQPAICSFIGTINNITGFLTDPSGSTRFRICKIRDIDWLGYTRMINVKQVWAQALYLMGQKEPIELTAADQARMDEINNDYQLVNNTRAALEEYFNIMPGNNAMFSTSNEIRETLQKEAGLHGPDLDAKKIANALYELGCKPNRAYVDGNRRRGYYGISKKLI